MEQVEIMGSKIVVRDLTLDDQETAQILGEYQPDEQIGVLKQAIRLGLIVRRQASTVGNVDFVKLEFQNLKQEMEKYWKDQVVKKIDETTKTYFDASEGILPRKLAQYFGGDGEKGKLGELFNEKNTESIPYQFRQMLKTELTGEGSAFLKALDPDDKNSPIGRLKKNLQDPIVSLRDKVVGKEAAKEVAETGTQKGAPYEDLVYRYVDQIGASFGDKVEDVSNQNVAGDYVSTLNPETVPGQSIRIAIDAKDKLMGMKACEDTLRDAKGRWDAQVALLVFAKEEQTPFSSPIGVRKLHEGYVCVFEKEDLDSRVLQTAYLMARIDAVRSVQRSVVQVDPALVQEKLEQAVQKLKDFVTLKRKITSTQNDLGSIREFVDTLHRECRENLEDAWHALGIKEPIPSLVEESQAEM